MFLGIQSQCLTDDGVAFCIRGDVRTFRAINDGHNPSLLWRLKRALPRCLFGLRLVRDVDLRDPALAAQEFYEALRPKLLEFPYDFTSGANETGYGTDVAAAYSEFNRLLAINIDADEEDQVGNVLYGGFDFGVTWPDVYLAHKYESGWRVSDFIGMHLYHLPHNADENTIYHHRQVRAALPADLQDKPIWATEFGLDVNGQEGEGWSGPTWGWTPQQYAAWLEETAALLSDVEHGIVFLGEETDPKWRSWRIVGHDVIADAMARANKAEDKRWEGIVAEHVFLFGFKDLADRLGAAVVGEPIEDQWAKYVNPLGMAPRKVVKQRTTTGYMQTEEVPADSGNWRSPQFFDDVGSRPKAEGPAKGVII